MEKIFTLVVGVIVASIVLAILMAFPTMWLWNYLMPSLFGLKTIGFWQAFWLNVFTGILFRSNVKVEK